MTKELRFYMGGYVKSLFEIIENCVSTFNRDIGESPNKISMSYEMFERLRRLANMNGIKLSKGNNTPATVFGMRVSISNKLDNNEIVLTKEENMRDDFIDSMRYAMERDVRERMGVNPYWLKKVERLPKKYIINKGATVLFWEDGSKTVVRRGKDDEYNKVLGFLWAYFQKTSGLSRTKANKYLAGLLDEDEIKPKETNNGRKHKIGDVVTLIGTNDKRTVTGYYDDVFGRHGYYLDDTGIAWFDNEIND